MSRYGDSMGSDFNVPGSFNSPKQRHKPFFKPQTPTNPQRDQSTNRQQQPPIKQHDHDPSPLPTYQVQRSQLLNQHGLSPSPKPPPERHLLPGNPFQTHPHHHPIGSQPVNGSPGSYGDNNMNVRTSLDHRRDASLSSQQYLRYIPPTCSQTNLSTLTSKQLSSGGNENLSANTASSDNTTGTGSQNNSSFSPTRGSSSTSKTTTALNSQASACAKCQQPISTKSVRALGKRYHLQCFGCHDCDTPFLKKYFPFETQSGEQIPLCEEHFYKRRGLQCCVCDKILNSTHYTIFGRKYDVEHFCCTICKKNFDTEEEFFNHDGNLFCHYHFSKFFVDRCEGCEFAILKQYVEIFRGGKNQKWHVECYMINKLWNIQITPESIGIKHYFERVKPTPQNIASGKDINPTPEELMQMETKSSRKILEIWKILLEFEGKTAGCISDMLQFATMNDQKRALETTARLVLKIECLFKALEALHRLGINSEQNTTSDPSTPTSPSKPIYQTLKREPRNLSAKIMVYLSILRNNGKPNSTQTETAKQDIILSAATGLAHYLKLLIRYGLHNALQFDKVSNSTNALDKFLREASNHEHIPNDVLNSLDVTIEASELCFHCHKNIESECIQFKNYRWHIDCLQCGSCQKSLLNYNDVSDASFDEKRDIVLCAQCAVSVPDAKFGFKVISKLLQLVYLLKIAIIRSKVTFENELKSKINGSSENNDLQEKEGFMKSLNDIKRLKSTRQNESISTNTNETTSVRKSVIMESTDLSKDDLLKHKITIEDEPLNHTSLSKGSFKRAANFINTQKVLTLDDISRIVAAEHARELRPNTYKYHDPHQEAPPTISKDIKSKSKSNSLMRGDPSIQNSIGSSLNSNSGNTDAKDLKYYSELTDDQRLAISHISVILIKHMVHRYRVPLDLDYNELIDLKKQPSFWDKLRGITSDHKKPVVLNKVFGAELKDLTAKTGVESSQSNNPSKMKIPMLIEDLLSALYQKDMSIEGIFRKNGNLKTLKELISQIDSDPSKVPDLLNENPIQLSALLKKFLREMPTPLLTFNLYDLWIQSQKLDDANLKPTFIELIYSLLPGTHRDLTEVLLFFFMWTSSFAHLDESNGSKMDIHNLATVLCPNILYANPSISATSAAVQHNSLSGKNPAMTYLEAFKGNEGENYYLAIELVNYLISHNEELSIVPCYLLNIYRTYVNENGSNLEKVTSKDIFHWVESYLSDNDIAQLILGKGANIHRISGEEEEEEEKFNVVKEKNTPLETDIES